MTQPSRRTLLKTTAAMGVCSAGTARDNSFFKGANRRDEIICLTDANDFYTVARGNPKPHTLKGEDLVKARMTQDSWRLEIDTDETLDPPIVKQIPSLEKKRLIQTKTAVSLAQLIELGRSKSVKFIKAIQCLNIPTPLGQGLWEGVPMSDLLRTCGRIQNVRRINYWGFHNNDPQQKFQSSLSYSQVFETPPGELPVFLAYRLNGKPITPLRGGPVRVIVPWAYGFKSIKWVQKIVLTNDPRANDTYSNQNNDPDSPLKTAAYVNRGSRKKFATGEAIQFSGLVISGLSGLDEVEYLIRERKPNQPPVRNDSDEIRNSDWKPVTIQSAPQDWDRILPEGVSSRDLLGFDSLTGRPGSWPLRYGMAGWSVQLKERLKSGTYEFRVRAVDANGIAQPEPRPLPKSGRNEIPVIRFTVVG